MINVHIVTSITTHTLCQLSLHTHRAATSTARTRRSVQSERTRRHTPARAPQTIGAPPSSGTCPRAATRRCARRSSPTRQGRSGGRPSRGRVDERGWGGRTRRTSTGWRRWFRRRRRRRRRRPVEAAAGAPRPRHDGARGGGDGRATRGENIGGGGRGAATAAVAGARGTTARGRPDSRAPRGIYTRRRASDASARPRGALRRAPEPGSASAGSSEAAAAPRRRRRRLWATVQRRRRSRVCSRIGTPAAGSAARAPPPRRADSANSTPRRPRRGAKFRRRSTARSASRGQRCRTWRARTPSTRTSTPFSSPSSAARSPTSATSDGGRGGHKVEFEDGDDVHCARGSACPSPRRRASERRAGVRVS